uniref:Uncharacterized protein n=1 Tax=Acrobeloides nanus TaxID=290746 RepID=A0A914CNP2_9BILA
MLLAIDFETRDYTESYKQFSAICDVATGKISMDQIKTTLDVPETPSPSKPKFTLRPSKYSAPNNLVAQAPREKSPMLTQRKTRSRTLPFKSVHWDDTIEFDDNTTVFI